MRFGLFPLAMVFLTAPVWAAPEPKLDDLFAALAQAKTPEVARPIEDEIARVWAASDSATTELLFSRGAQSIQKGDLETAARLFDAINALEPDFVAGWVMRADVHIMRQESNAAIVALQKALQIEPRQFAALVSLGQVMEAVGDQKGALKAYDAALKLDPALADVRSHADALRKKVQGDPI